MRVLALALGLTFGPGGDGSMGAWPGVAGVRSAEAQGITS